jgi:RNA-directed DNA polymerase
MQALHRLGRDPIAETLAEPNAYGFRLERSTADAIDQGPRVLSRRWSAQWLVEGDLRACCDRISHDGLMAPMPMDTAMLKQWLGAGCMDKDVLSPTAAGVPQGGIASPACMTLTLNGLEQYITGAFPRYQGHQRTKVQVRRFADDFIITGTPSAVLEQEVSPLVEQFLAERGRELSRAKPRITSIEDGVDVLGTHVRKYNGKWLCTPAQKNVHAFRETVRTLVKRHQQATAGQLILQRKPVIRGGAQYHQHGASQRTFAQVDQQIFPRLWQWARRRHPKQARWWIKDKYFRSENGNTWVFFGPVLHAKDTGQDVRLVRATSVPIRRHTKIQGEANPYDPQWEPYFAARWGLRMAQKLRGRRPLLRLWKEQQGLCAVCHQCITQLTGWHSHHMVWRAHGGSDRAENRVLLHPICHAQVHSQGLIVGKPRPQAGVGKA